MTEKKTTPKPKTARARAPKVKAENPNRVAVLTTHTGFPLFLRANPSEQDVIGFVTENNRRYHAGEPSGPSGQPALLVKSAAFYESEEDALADNGAQPIDL